MSAAALAKHLSAQSQGRRVTKGFLTDTLSVSSPIPRSHWGPTCRQWTPSLCSVRSSMQPIMVADRLLLENQSLKIPICPCGVKDGIPPVPSIGCNYGKTNFNPGLYSNLFKNNNQRKLFTFLADCFHAQFIYFNGLLFPQNTVKLCGLFLVLQMSIMSFQTLN